MKRKTKPRTAKATAQSRRRETRRAFSGFTHFAPIGFVSVSLEGNIVDVNPVGASQLGLAPKILIGQQLTGVITIENRSALTRFMKRARVRSVGKTDALELEAVTETGRYLKLIARRAVAADRGTLLVAIVDLTKDRRQAEARRQAAAVEIAERAAAEAARATAMLARLVTAQEEERRRIARNLHDDLGQHLTALRLMLDGLSGDASTSETTRRQLAAAESIVSRLDQSVDRLVANLRPPTLDDNGLPPALAELVRQWAESTQIHAEFHGPIATLRRLTPEAESNLYRIVQEALTNVARHARATHVSVLMERQGDAITIIIEDNGRGFDTKVQARSRLSRMGLVGMSERAALIDGNLQIESVPGRGTTVFVRVPAARSG